MSQRAYFSQGNKKKIDGRDQNMSQKQYLPVFMSVDMALEGLTHTAHTHTKLKKCHLNASNILN